MRATTTFADLSADRPSLLMRFLAAIGPGTVLCKTSSLDIRHDGTSLALLRARLPHYAFLPVPNAHYVRRDVAAIRRAHEVVVDRPLSDTDTDADTDADAAAIRFLRAQGLDPGGVLREWIAQLDLGDYGTPQFAARLRRIYQVPQTGPLIVVGAPEDYLGYPPLDHPTEPDPHDTELRALLIESGYARRFQSINAFKRAAGAGIEELRPVRRHHPITPADSRPFVDIGLIHLGRTAAGRTVMVVSGSSHPFGTLGGVRICCDHARNRLQQLVAEFADGKRHEVALLYRVRPQVDGTDEPPLSATAPIDVDFVVTDDVAVPSELTIREAEVRFTPLLPSAPPGRLGTGLLADHLTRRGSVSVVVKSYPVDRRDDATAKDLLEAALPGLHEVPVPENVPHRRAAADDASLAASIADVLALGASPGSVVATLAGLDGEWWQRVAHWQRVLAARHGGSAAFKALVDEGARLPASGPLLILGNPRAFLGADAVDGATADARPQLATLLEAIGFPNRYELAGLEGDHSLVTDHKLLRRVAVPSADEADRDTDVGIVYLTRGPEDRDILVIAGNHWLGTLAGVQLLFAEQRPGIDRLVQAYVDGRRRSVEIGYRCRRVEQRDAPEGSRFPMVHPSVDLEVELLDKADLDEPFTRSCKADEHFGGLWRALDTREGSTAVVGGDSEIELRVSGPVGRPLLSITCRSCLHLPPGGDRQGQLIFRSKPTVSIHDEFIDRVHQAWRSYRHDVATGTYRCYCFLVVGPPGSGKESMGAIVQRTLGGETPLVPANVAGLPESLMLSALFGHDKGSFTGASADRKGLFETVGDGGVLVLDEFAAGSAVLQEQFQPALLRFLQFGTGQAIGAVEPFRSRLFLLASTNEAETLDGIGPLVRERRVRADLIDRFGHRCELPPLRARPLEILPTFLWMFDRARSGPAAADQRGLGMAFERRALERLLHHPWPGNFRQLEQVAERVAHELDHTTDATIRDAALARALGIGTEEPVPGGDPSLVTVRVTWTAVEIPTVPSPVRHRSATGPVPRPRIEWPLEDTVAIREWTAIPDALELCRRLVVLGSDPGGRHAIRKPAATMLGESSGAQTEGLVRSLDGGRVAADEAERLADAVLDGIVRFGRDSVRSYRFSAPFVAKWLLVALAAENGVKEKRRVDPGKVKRLRFPLADVSWEPLWRHLEKHALPGPINAQAGRVLREMALLLLTGVDIRGDESLRQIAAASKMELPRTRRL